MEIKAKKRSEIAAEFKWNLETMFKTQDEWRADVDSLPAEYEAISAFQGKLTTGETLLSCLNKVGEVGETVSRVYVYANLKMHEDANISESRGMADTAQNMYTKFYAAIAFLTPEILAIDEAELAALVANTPGLDLYKQELDDIQRKKAHTLSAEIEEIMANAMDVGSASSNIYDMLTNTDLKFGNVTDEDGNTVEVTQGRAYSLLESHNRQVRKDTFETLCDSYWKLKNAFATMYSSSVKTDIFDAKTRKYKSSLDAALAHYNIPRAVYEQLIEAVNEYLPVLHRYVALRKNVLGVESLHMYDRLVPLVDQVDTTMTYEEAKEKLMEGLKPLGAEYLSEMESGMNGGWIDVYENEGKQSGAYSWGAPGKGGHPYVLLNYENRMNDMFTLAHEMGHAMHSYYSWKTQPRPYTGYSIFLAEVASTVNETIIMDHMLKTTTDPKVRTYLLDEYIGQFHGTIFRQTMFAEFELITHTMAENGEPLTLDVLNKTFRELNIKYFGPAMDVDELSDIAWAQIPHFYRAFYVYQYATGYAAAVAFNQRLQTGDAKALEDYLGFLKAGSHDYSIEILKKAGVDMSTPTPVREALKVFEELVTELEKELA